MLPIRRSSIQYLAIVLTRRCRSHRGVALGIVAGATMGSISASPLSSVCARPPPIRVVYFVPADREPLSNRVERLDRTLEDVRQFYRDGMVAAGYGPMTFELERDATGQLVLHEVRGRFPSRQYGRNDAHKVREEVHAALAKRGIDPNRELLLIVQVLLAWEGERAVEIGPYVGSGDGRYGAAHVYDDDRLDAARLESLEPGGWYGGRPCSIGRFNTHYIGGIAHELGHAFGLPHDCETESERRTRGRSLMGSGNHTYGEDRRGEGLGTFLSATSAMQLRWARSFAGDVPNSEIQPIADFAQFQVATTNGRLVLTGTVTGSPPVWGLAAWNDSAEKPNDYDAVGRAVHVGADGQFRLEIGELTPGRYELRFRTIHTNGRRTTRRFSYRVEPNGMPDGVAVDGGLHLERAIAARVDGDRVRAARIACEVLARAPPGHIVWRKASHFLHLLDPPPPGPTPACVPERERVAELSSLAFTQASVGWGRVLRDETPETVFLTIDGEFFPRGLWAHAPAQHVFDLGSRWSRFRSHYGLHDQGRGSVVFVVRGDGREIYRSDVVRDHRLRTLEVDVRGVEQLSLVVEDAADGIRSDWGVWIHPVLER